MGTPAISIIGVGYVGLCTGVGFASKGFSVVAADNDSEKIAKLKEGTPTFYEPNLHSLLKETIENGLLHLTNSTEKAVVETEITYIAVGTPSKLDGSIDLKFIEAASYEIGKALSNKTEYHTVVVKSTVVPGTTQNRVKPILERNSQKKCGEGFGLCMNPEFLRQGSAFHDTFHPDRVVIGQYDKNSGDAIERLNRKFYQDDLPPVILTTLSTAELIKYASNSLLATKISFINTIANICEKIPEADVTVVAKAVGMDKRIGPLFLNAGLGYGGSCFPKDVKALIACSKAYGYEPKILESVEEVNETQSLKAVEFCKEQLFSLEGKKIAILGLAFKPDTDDMREARVIPIINQLLKEGANVSVYDPVAIPVAQKIFKNQVQFASSTIDCLTNADAAILVTEWEEFKNLTPNDFSFNMKQAILFDGRRIYNPQVFSKTLKFKAIGLG